MKLGITGSRSIMNFDFCPYFTGNDKGFNAFLKGVSSGTPDTVVSGGAKGVDTLAAAAAQKCGLQNRILKPDTKNFHGRMAFAAYFERDEKIVREADALLAVWNGEISSHGTLYTMNAAIEDGVPVWLIVLKDGKIVRQGHQNEVIEYPKRCRMKKK